MLDKELLKTRVSKPNAEELLKQFADCVDYCIANQLILTKHIWIVYLGVSKDTYWRYQNRDMSTYLTDAEFNERCETLKKIEGFIEAGMSNELLTAKYPTGTIFYLKNAFKWADKQEPDNTFNFKFDGFGPTKTPKTDAKKDGSVTSSVT